jgi:hypothetical protein
MSEKPERQPLTSIYPPEIVAVFPTFEDEVKGFLETNKGVVVNLETPTEEVERCAKELQELATTVATGIKEREIDIFTLFRGIIQPARRGGIIRPEDKGQVGLIFGRQNYHILERDKVLVPELLPANSLILLLQRVPYGKDTGAEIHGIKEVEKGKFVPTEIGGIEIYLPLVDDITFYINEKEYKPKALEGILTILPGDVHHHIKEKGKGPARVLIIGGGGFSRGTKTENKSFRKFERISRYTSLT